MFLFLSGGEGGFNPLHVEQGLLFWSLVTFLLLFVILKKVAWGPLTKAIEERETKIRSDIDAAEKARAEADAAMARYKTQLDQAALEAKRMLDEAREASERVKNEILAKAREESESMRAQAAKEIASARDKAIAEIRTQIVDVAMSVSQRFLTKAIDKKEHERLTEEALAKSGELV
jgi:F-type H+-transporting ATPase subunit b